MYGTIFCVGNVAAVGSLGNAELVYRELTSLGEDVVEVCGSGTGGNLNALWETLDGLAYIEISTRYTGSVGYMTNLVAGLVELSASTCCDGAFRTRQSP